MNGFVDLQVNGYAGTDFNSDRLTIEQLVSVCERLADDGVETILATIITAPIESMIARISRIAAWIEQVPEISRMIAGIHVEGPFLNRQDGFAGAHPQGCIMPADSSIARRLVDAGRGTVRMLTLAPETDAGAIVTNRLATDGIVVSAGHSDATLDQLDQAIDGGLSAFTHLGNGCPGQLPRHDNIVQRVLSMSDRLIVSFIADGHHIPWLALGNYLRTVPTGNIAIVTDAISAAGLGPGRYELAGQAVEVDPSGAAWAAGRQHYAGCATSMRQMARMLKSQLGADDADIDRWTITNPARLLNL